MSSNHRPWRRGVLPAVTVLALAVSVVLVAVTGPQAGEPPVSPLKPPPIKKLSVEEYRKLYPIESLTDRLSYETEPAKELLKSGPAPRLTTDAANRLDEAEKAFAVPPRWDLRRRSLEILHSNEAQKFVDRDGFGISRMPSPSISALQLPAAPTTLFANPSEAIDPNREESEVLSKGVKGVAVGDKRMPSLETLGSFHFGGEMNFVNASGFGLIKDRDHVAGFQAHQFRTMPDLNDPRVGPKGSVPAKEKWLVTRLELVSLLKQKDPAVYVAAELPRMEELKKAKTRSLTDFEERGLAGLRAGEEMMTEATTNSIRMVGALRATKQCLECHQVRRGDLLGAFSYDLRRDPPLKAAP